MAGAPIEHRWFAAEYDHLESAIPEGLALRVIPRCAARLVTLACLQRGQRVLDAWSGGEAWATTTARVVGPISEIVTVDFSPGRQGHAWSCADAAANSTRKRMEGSACRLAFPDNHFDVALARLAALCPTQAPSVTGEICRVLKRGGRLAVSGFGDDALQPLMDMYERALRRYCLSVPAQPRPSTWQRPIEPAHYRGILQAADLQRIKVRNEQFGFYLDSAEEWWQLMNKSEFHRPLAQVPPGRLAEFRAEYLEEVAALKEEHGIWLDIPTIFAIGSKP